MAEFQPVDEALADLDEVVYADQHVVDVQLEALEQAVPVQAVDELEQRVLLDGRTG